MQVAKYSASGNDFVIFHTFVKKDRSEMAKQLCDRHEGVGADGLIVSLPHEKYDFEWQFYNSDGSEASMCGNGTRACAHYAFSNGLAKKNMQFLTKAGLINAFVDGDVVTSQLTAPKTLKKPFEKGGHLWHFYDTGVPHLVSFVSDLDACWDLKLIKQMREEFNANVNFAKISKRLEVRTFERGVEGETKACGTGMVACFLGAFNDKKINSNIEVMPKSGEILEVKTENGMFFLKGKVRKVFETSLDNIKH